MRVTDGPTLTEFLRARLDEDERLAQEASGDPWVLGTSKGYQFSRPGDIYAISRNGTPARIAQGTRCGPDISAEQSSEHIVRHNPARALAEVAAKRAILDESGRLLHSAREHRGDLPLAGAVLAYEKVIKLLAQPYAGQPGWRDEWTVSG